MDEDEEKSCWGLTAKTLAGFVGIIALAWLFGGAESAAIFASASG
jgi:hypothetical protein